MSLVVDASVFVSAQRASEQSHADSLEFVTRIDFEETSIVCPTIAITEVVAAIGKVIGDERAALNALSDVALIPGLEFVPVTDTLARNAAGLAATLRLRAADSIYVQIARDTGAALITWDREVLSRASTLLSVMTPREWLDANRDAP